MSDLSSFFSASPGAGGNGLTWAVVSANTTAVSSNGYIFDNSSSAHTLTLPATPTVGNTVGYKDLNGYFGSFPLTIIGNGAKIQGVVDTMLIDTNNAYGVLTYSGATQGWVLTSASIGYPMVGKPMLHVQDQKTAGTAGGTSVAGTQTRTLNTILVNDITGASLASNQFTLPAGEYWIECEAPAYTVGNHTIRLFNVTTSSVVYGSSESAATIVTNRSFIRYRLSLSTSNTFYIQHYTAGAVTTNGLGVPIGGSNTEVYTDVRVYKLDSDRVFNPKVFQPINQPVTGAYVTGGIWGGELNYVATNQFSVNAFSCMADDNATALFINSTTTVTITSPVLNTNYFVFAVKYNTSLYGIKYDTDVNGANLGASVVAKRRLGFVITNASAQIMPFIQAGDILDWTVGTNKPVLTASTTASYLPYSIGAILPISILSNVVIQAQTILTFISYDGTTDWTLSGISSNMGPIVNLRPVYNIYLKYTSSSGPVHILSVTLRR